MQSAAASLSPNRTVGRPTPRKDVESQMILTKIKRHSHHWVTVTGAVLLAVTVGQLAPPASAQEADEDVIPGAPHLLPDGVYVYARLDNADELRDGLAKSSIGKMLNDPELKPFASDIYSTAKNLFEQISDEVGVSLDELLSIPSGQIAFALAPGNPPDADREKEQAEDDDDDSDRAVRRRLARKLRDENSFAGIFIIDAGDNVDKLQAIIDRLELRMTTDDGYVRRNTKVGKTTIVRLLPPRSGRPEVEYFEREGTIVFGIGHKIAQDVLDRWRGKNDDPTFADSSNFSSVMARCVGAESTRPQLTFYVDPYHIAEKMVIRSGSFTAGMFWPMVENLGLSRIRGLGASSFAGGEIFEDIIHVHLLIDPPRDGLLGVLRPETGDTTPPDWTPEDVTSYTTVNWDHSKTYENVGKIIDTFQGADSLVRFAETPFTKSTGLDIKKDILENLTGRLVRAVWMEPPARLNSQTFIVGLELTDPLAAKSVIAKLRERFPNALKPETIAGKVVYFSEGGRRRVPEAMRQPEPCLTIVGNWILGTDSRKLMTRALQANSGVIPRLIELPEYDLVTSELGGKLDGEKPFMLSYTDSSDFIRQVYDLAQADSSKEFMRNAGQGNVVARKASDLLNRHQLPPFEKFEKYFAPTGVFAYDEPAGIHLGMFTLRADAEASEKTDEEDKE